MSPITITELTGLNTDHYPLDGRYSGTWSGNAILFSTPYGDYQGKASTYQEATQGISNQPDGMVG